MPKPPFPRRLWLTALPALVAPVLLGPRRAHGQGARLRVGGSGAGLGGIGLLAPGLARQGLEVRLVPGLGSAGGLRALRAGLVDVAVIASVAGVPPAQDGLAITAHARTPVVFATHSGTAAESLSMAEAVAMVAGRVTRWADGRLVRLSRRPDADTDTLALANLSAEMAQAVSALQRQPGVISAGSDHDQAEALEVVPGTLGVLGLSLILSEGRPLKVLPLREFAASGAASPVAKGFWFATRRDAAEPVAAFLRHAISPAAWLVLAGHGHLPPDLVE